MENILTIGISTRALFDLEYENSIFVERGAAAYVDYMVSHEQEVIKKGLAFGLIQALLRLNELWEKKVCEVIVMSQNSADSSLRIFNSISEYGLDIRTAIATARSAPSHERVIRTFRSWGVRIDEAHFLGGMDKTAVLKAFGANIFFDDNEDNIKAASNIVLAAKVPNFLRVV